MISELSTKLNRYCLWPIFKYMYSESHSVMSNSPQPQGLCSPWNSLGQNTGVGSLSLLQGIFPTQGSNPGLPHCRQIPYQLSHKGSPILEWVAYPFSSGSSWPKYQTRVSWIAGGFFTNWAIREAQHDKITSNYNISISSRDCYSQWFCKAVSWLWWCSGSYLIPLYSKLLGGLFLSLIWDTPRTTEKKEVRAPCTEAALLTQLLTRTKEQKRGRGIPLWAVMRKFLLASQEVDACDRTVK